MRAIQQFYTDGVGLDLCYTEPELAALSESVAAAILGIKAAGDKAGWNVEYVTLLLPQVHVLRSLIALGREQPVFGMDMLGQLESMLRDFDAFMRQMEEVMILTTFNFPYCGLDWTDLTEDTTVQV